MLGISGLRKMETKPIPAYPKGSLTQVQVEGWVPWEQVKRGLGIWFKYSLYLVDLFLPLWLLFTFIRQTGLFKNTLEGMDSGDYITRSRERLNGLSLPPS